MATLGFTTLFKDRGAARGVTDLADKFEKAAGSATNLETATKRLAMAESKVADAAGQVRVAEARLDMVRKNAKATSVQRLQAEENLTRAQRRLTSAQNEVKISSDKVAAAQKHVKTQLAQSAEQAQQTEGRMRRAVGGLRAFGSAGVNATGRVVGGFKAVGVGAAGVAVGILAAAAAPITFGLKTAAAMENAEIAFTTMLGSARKARSFLEDLKRFAAATPFEFPELQDAASSLISVGVNAKNVIPIMTTLGNITSGMGTGAEGVKRATIAIQQMSASGRISAEDLNQLRDAGVPLNLLFDAMAARLGTTSKKLMAMREDGTLGRKELDALMASLQSGKGFDRFNGLMDKQSRSLNGMLSTLKDTFGQGMANAFQGAIPFIKDGINRLTNLLGTFFDWSSTHQEDMVNGFIGVGDALFQLAEGFLQLNVTGLRAFAGLVDAAATFTDAMAKLPFIGKQFEGIGDSLRPMAAGIRGTAGDIESQLLPKIVLAHSKWSEFGRDQRTQAALRDANAKIQQAVHKTTEALKKNGHTVDENTTAGRNNREVLKSLAQKHLNYLDKLKATDAGTKRVSKATNDARENFIRVATKITHNRKKAEELATAYGLLKTKIDKVPKNPTIKLTAKFHAKATKAAVEMLKYVPGSQQSGFADALAGRAEGGEVPGRSPHAKADNILIRATAGEYVQQKKAVNYYGLETMKAINEQKVPKLALQQFAGGGLVHAEAPPSFGATAREANKKAATAAWKRGYTAAVKEMNASSFGPGGLPSGGGAIGHGMGALFRYASRMGMGHSTYPGHGERGMNKAWDFMPISGGRGNRLAGHAWANAKDYGIWYVIWNRRIASRTRPGAGWRPYTRYGNTSNPNQAHTNHVHVSWYDKGGMLRPGQTGTNESGLPERVLTPANTKSFDRLVRVMDRSGGAANTYITINAPNYVGSQDDLRRTLVDMNRRGQLEVIKKR